MKRWSDGKWRVVLVATVAGVLGAALGAAVLRGTPAEAQARYTTCFGAIQEVVDINDDGDVQQPPRSRTIQVPTGWAIAGAGGGAAPNGRHVYVLFCR